MSRDRFQPMPALTTEQSDALREDIIANGVMVPVVVDQFGRVLDGNNRMAIATELGIECPTTTVVVVDDDDAHERALKLNCARRHLTQEQKRVLIADELIRRPKDADRAIARRLGCSPTTVGTVRAERRREAEERTAAIHHAMHKCATNLFGACYELILSGAEPQAVTEKLALGRDETHEATIAALKDENYSVEGVTALISHYVYTAVFNDVTAVVEAVREAGVEFPLPEKIPNARMVDLVEALYPLARVQIGQAATEVVA